MDSDNLSALRDKQGRFVKGYKSSELPQEFKEKRIKSMIESHGKRGSNAKIKREYPYIFNSWRAIMFSKKYKNDGISEEWKNFKTFFDDVVGSYEKGKVFRRLDASKPFSKDNFLWCTTEQAGQMNKRTIHLEYNGELLTLKELAEKYDQSYIGVKIRYNRREKHNYTIDEIIFGKRKKRNDKKAKDISDPNVIIRAKASKMISSYKCKDKKLGFQDCCDIDIDWMIENIFNKPCVYCEDTKRIGCDRINNDRPHTKDNVVPCCIECNTARNNFFSFEEMKVIGKSIKEVKEKRI